MSISKFVGRSVLVSFVVYLFVKGALVLRPKETVAAITTLVTALVHACAGGEPSPNHGAVLEERRERDLVGECQGNQRREGDVDAPVLDHAQVLGVKPGEFGGCFLGQIPLLPKAPELQSESALGTLDGLLETRAKPDL